MIWAIFDSANRCFIYREWPCPDEYVEGVGYPGMWAEPDGKKADGRKGPRAEGLRLRPRPLR